MPQPSLSLVEQAAPPTDWHTLAEPSYRSPSVLKGLLSTCLPPWHAVASGSATQCRSCSPAGGLPSESTRRLDRLGPSSSEISGLNLLQAAESSASVILVRSTAR